MNAVRIKHADDERIWMYRALKERELARQGNRFIAEGEHVVRRLFASDFRVESALLSNRRVGEIGPVAPSGATVFVAEDEVMRQIIGYKFHSGVIACGFRKPALSLDELVPPDKSPITLMILPEIAATDNMGALVRIAAGFGADALILGERSCDPFFRQSIRVSMGTIFRMPIFQSADLLHDLRRLRAQSRVELVAAVVDDSAEVLSQARRTDRMGLVFGNEAQGLSRAQIDACDRRVTIPMKLGTDSLNVAVAAGVFLHHFTR